MDKLKSILNPGKKADDEVLYGEGNPNNLGKVTGEGTHFGASRTTAEDEASGTTAAAPEHTSKPTATEPTSSTSKGQGSHFGSSPAAAPESTSIPTATEPTSGTDKGQGSHFGSSRTTAGDTATGTTGSAMAPSSHDPSSTTAAAGSTHKPLPKEPTSDETTSPSQQKHPGTEAGPTVGATTAAMGAAYPTHQKRRGPDDNADTLDRSLPGAFGDDEPVGTAHTTGPDSSATPHREHPTAGTSTSGPTHNDPLKYDSQPSDYQTGSQAAPAHKDHHGAMGAAGAGAAGLVGYEGAKHLGSKDSPADRTSALHEQPASSTTGSTSAEPPHSGFGGTSEQQQHRTDPSMGAAPPADTQSSMKSTAHPLDSTTQPSSTVGQTRPGEHDSHLGRDAALGAGAAGLGAGAAHHHHEHEPKSAGTGAMGGQSHPTATTGVQGPVSTPARSEPTSAPQGATTTHAPTSTTATQSSTAPTSYGEKPKDEHHYGRDAALGAGAGGAAGLATHEHGKDKGKEPLTESLTHGTEEPKKEGTMDKLKSIFSRDKKDKDEPELVTQQEPHKDSHHKGEAAAGVGAGAVGAAALEEEHRHKEREAHEKAQKEAAEQRKKEAAEAEKQHHKDVVAAEKEHKKEVKQAEKEHEKEVKAAEKQHDKEVKAAEKEHKKEEKAIAKEHEKEEKEAEKQAEKQKKHEAEAIAAAEAERKREREKHEKEAAAAAEAERKKEQHERDQKHHEKEAAAGAAGAAAVGGAAYAHHQHDPSKTPGDPSTHSGPTSTTATSAGMDPQEAFRRQQQEKDAKTAAGLEHEREREAIQHGHGAPGSELDEGKDKKTGGLLGIFKSKKDKDGDVEDEHEKSHGHGKEAAAAGAAGAAGAGGAAYATDHDHRHYPRTPMGGVGRYDDPSVTTGPQASAAPAAGTQDVFGGHPSAGQPTAGHHDDRKDYGTAAAGTGAGAAGIAAVAGHEHNKDHATAPGTHTQDYASPRTEPTVGSGSGLGGTHDRSAVDPHGDKHHRHKAEGLAAHEHGLQQPHGSHAHDTPGDVNTDFKLGEVSDTKRGAEPSKSDKILGIIPKKESKDHTADPAHAGTASGTHHKEEAAAATAGTAGTAGVAKHEHDKHAAGAAHDPAHHHDDSTKEKPSLLDKLLHRHPKEDKAADESAMASSSSATGPGQGAEPMYDSEGQSLGARHVPTGEDGGPNKLHKVRSLRGDMV